MTKLPAAIMPTALIDGHFQFHPTGLEVVGDPTFDEWAEMVETLKAMEKALQFWLGDLLNYGEQAYGQKYSQFLDIRDVGTLRNYAWVANKVDASLRNDTLTWDHHRRVAALPPSEQAEWLQKAEAEHLSARQLHREIAEVDGGSPALLFDGEGTLANLPSVIVDEEGRPLRWLVRFEPGPEFGGVNGTPVWVRVVERR